MRVKVQADFRDREDDLKLRKSGDQFEANEERAVKLASLGLVEILQEKISEKKG